MEKEKEEFKPFVPAEKQMKEFNRCDCWGFVSRCFWCGKCIPWTSRGNDGVSVNSGGGCINGDSARFAAPQFYLRK